MSLLVQDLQAASLPFHQHSATVDKSQAVKFYLLQDRKKNVYFVLARECHFDGLKKLSKDVGVKDLRFISADVLEKAEESPAFCSPRVLTAVEGNVTVCRDSSIEEKGSVEFNISETSSIKMEVQDLLSYVLRLKPGSEIVAFTSGGPSEGSEIVPSPSGRALPSATADVDSKNVDDGGKSGPLIGLTVTRAENFPDWYTQVIQKAELIEYYDVSGCYILRPWAFEMWERITEFLDSAFKKRKVKNVYFPSFVTKARLETEADHIEGFAAEVAWVTKSGSSDLVEPIAIRPTSETIMYPAFAKWIRSHRDLPLLLNQWCAVVRWEFKQPTPFIRTREFLWQEGHTAHETHEEGIKFAADIINVYQMAYQDLLAVPVIAGIKSEKEKFAGGHTTFTVEGFIPANGRGLQCATSHFLSTNFAKMFGIEFEDKQRARQTAHQTSWGFTTRSIGAMIMVHGDDNGLVLPPRVAPIQVVIVPVLFKSSVAAVADFSARCDSLRNALEEGGIRSHLDDRTTYNPGWKYNNWDLKGVPIRLEIGPREMKDGSVRMVRRVDGAARIIDGGINLIETIKAELEDIHNTMFERAKKAYFEEGVIKVDRFEKCMDVLNNRKLVLAPWCGKMECEEAAKKETARLSQELEEATGMGGAMKTLCTPMDRPPLAPGVQCFRGDGPAVCETLWGRSY